MEKLVNFTVLFLDFEIYKLSKNYMILIEDGKYKIVRGTRDSQYMIRISIRNKDFEMHSKK